MALEALELAPDGRKPGSPTASVRCFAARDLLSREVTPMRSLTSWPQPAKVAARKLFTAGVRPPAGARRRPPRMGVECLEDRSVPTAVSWDGGAGTTNWLDAANWNNPARPDIGGDALPGPDDDALINAPGV